jgi:hypothetical protein
LVGLGWVAMTDGRWEFGRTPHGDALAWHVDGLPVAVVQRMPALDGWQWWAEAQGAVGSGMEDDGDSAKASALAWLEVAGG